MKNTRAIVLHLPLFLPPALLLLAPGGFFACVHALQCPSTLQTVDHNYFIATAPTTGNEQRSTTMYVRPQKNLTVVLEVHGKSSKTYAAEFLLERKCFEGNWQWWALFVMVEHTGHYTDNNLHQVMSTYKLEVRTNTCIKQCVGAVNMRSLDSLHVRASGSSQWKHSAQEGQCGNIAPWNTTKYQQSLPRCSDVSFSPLSASQPGGVIGGVIAGVVVVAVIVMILVRKRRAEPTGEAVAMRPQDMESPREENVNSLYEGVDGQGSVNSLYETVGSHGSINSLYEPFENFLASQ